MKKLLLSAALFLAFTQHSYAQEDMSVNSIVSNITLKQNGVVEVTEEIEVEFPSERHGIFRRIPYVYDIDGQAWYTELDIKKVERNGEEEQYSISRDSSELELKIGDPNETITGEHTYFIRYESVGALRGFENYDEIYWDVAGEWPVTVGSVTAHIQVEGTEILDMRCFTGVYGSIFQCVPQRNAPEHVTFTAENLAPGDQLTVVASYPKDIIPLTTVEKPKTFFEKLLDPQSIAALLATVIIGIGTLLFNWAKIGRDMIFFGKYIFDPNAKKIVRPLGHKDTIVVEYEPPDNLRPAEIGVLMDERADTLDVTSTIVDLAVRGYLKIKEIKKKWMFGSTDYELTRTKKSDKDLLSYERELLDRIFEKENSIKVSSLKKKFYDDLIAVKNQLYKDLLEKNLFPANPDKIKNLYFGIAFAILAAGIGLFIFSAINNIGLTGAVGVGAAITGLNAMIVSRAMPRRSAHGAEAYRRARGYYLFLDNVEKHKQKFFEDKNMFNNILPYAIVFGLTDKIADAMKDMSINPTQPSWYTGTGTFNPAVFSSSVSSFSNTFSSSMSARASSSSGFSSGGGFSGGGFGGGSGGSW